MLTWRCDVKLEEALKIVGRHSEDNDTIVVYDVKIFTQALAVIVKEAEKGVAKIAEMTVTGDGEICCICPCCGIIMLQGRKKFKRCPECGQAIIMRSVKGKRK